MKLPILIGIVALLAVGLIGIWATDFTAYLGNDPVTCNNCHVMDYVYEGWYHAGHNDWATCNDCHTPHALIPKYYIKALSGYHHVTTFYLGEIPDAIRAKESSREIIQENCLRCHAATVDNIEMGQIYGEVGPQRYCFECHRSVAHGQRGLSLLPYQDKGGSK